MSAKDTRDYFEKGCLCILTHRMPVYIRESDEVAADRYMSDCKCSRGVFPYDVDYDNMLRAEWMSSE